MSIRSRKSLKKWQIRPRKTQKSPVRSQNLQKQQRRVSTPVSTKKVETWKPAELNETKNGQLTFF